MKAYGVVVALIGVGIIGWMVFGGRARTLAERIA